MARFRFILVCVVALATGVAGADLGGDSKSVDNDRDGLSSDSKDDHRSYSPVQDGTEQGHSYKEFSHPAHRIREYYNASGQIYAVTWNGMTPPSLRVFLGKNYHEYKKATQNQQKLTSGLRAPVVVNAGPVTVVHSGKMRNIRGVAFISALVPDGVVAEELP